jgi:hypothetical protein
MDDSVESSQWLLLIHSLPPKPDYLRVKVRRRLHHLGAKPLRGSVYVLPDTEEAREDFQWLLGEIRAQGGEAILCRAAFLEGINEEELRAMFESTASGPQRQAGHRAADQVEPGRTWVTRGDVHVDRMASAWLIRRFIDSRAHFKFVPPRGYRPESAELRFDMSPAEYTHQGELCTFQVLLNRFDLGDPGLGAIGEIVRDIDCKDAKYARPETPGIAALIRGIVESDADDQARLARAAPLFDSLLQHFSGRRS